MTLTDEALKLIADRGPMRFKEVQTATGWPAKRCKWVLQYLVERRFDLQRNNGFFELTDANAVHPMPNPQNQPADRTGQHGLSELLRQAGGQDAPGQGAGQSHAGRDCKAPRKPTESGCAGACGRGGAGVTA